MMRRIVFPLAVVAFTGISSAASVAQETAPGVVAPQREERSVESGIVRPPATPFGLRMGLSVAELRRLGATPTQSPGVYQMRTVPEPHRAFETYLVVASRVAGLCNIRAVGENITSNNFGEQLEGEFERLENALRSKYGAGRRFDMLRSGSLWDEPRDWMMGLLRKDRTLETYWLPDSATLPEDLAGINLEAHALSSTEGYVSLAYELTNFSRCKAELQAAASDPL
jgi:hypothetical protein